MKKSIVSFLIAALTLTSCSQEDAVQPSNSDNQPVVSNFRTVSDAINIANNVLAKVSGNSRSNLSVSKKKVHVITSRSSRAGEIDTLLYALDIDNGNGFVIINGPTNIEPIVAITESGSFDSEETKSNPGFQYALAAAEENAKQAAASIIVRPITPTPAFDDKLVQSG